MSTRETILARLRSRTAPPPSREAIFATKIEHDYVARFIVGARAAAADVHEIASRAEIPRVLEAKLAGTGTNIPLHLPADSPLRDLAWQEAARLVLDDGRPSAGSVALSSADFAIAETGTLAFLSGPARPSAWHFLPGIEFVLVERENIVPTLEVLFARLTKDKWPATLNLVTGPSRTADIEQTIERGAHGPRELHILLAGS